MNIKALEFLNPGKASCQPRYFPKLFCLFIPILPFSLCAVLLRASKMPALQWSFLQCFCSLLEDNIMQKVSWGCSVSHSPFYLWCPCTCCSKKINEWTKVVNNASARSGWYWALRLIFYSVDGIRYRRNFSSYSQSRKQRSRMKSYQISEVQTRSQFLRDICSLQCVVLFGSSWNLWWKPQSLCR